MISIIKQYEEGESTVEKFQKLSMVLVDSSTVIYLTSPFVIFGVSDLFFRFYSISEGKSCKQTV